MKNSIEKSPISLTYTELEKLIVLIKEVHGFDFGHYAKASLKRRVLRIMQLNKVPYFDLCNQLINDEHYFDYFLMQITVNITEMFRDPTFFRAIKEDILPYLDSYPHIKVWSAGCSTGEELYSLAILFEQAKLYDRSFFYGTDINQDALAQAKDGIYKLNRMKVYSENFIGASNKNSMSDYYTAKYDAASINRKLKKNMLFSTHNLVSDGPFNEFQLISCRNVLIYFDVELQLHVIKLFYDSLANFGFLCLGSKETIRNSELLKKFKIIDRKHNIYQKIN